MDKVAQSIHSISGPPSREERAPQETRVRGAAVAQPSVAPIVEQPWITKIGEQQTPSRDYTQSTQQVGVRRDSHDLRTFVVPVQFKPVYIEKEYTPNADLDDEYLECIILNNPQVEEYFKWKNRKGHGTFDEFLESLKKGPLTGDNLFKGSRMVSPRSSSARSIRGLGLRDTTESKVSNFADERLRDSVSVPQLRQTEFKPIASVITQQPIASLSQSVYQTTTFQSSTPAFGTRPAQEVFTFSELPAQMMTGTNPAVYTQMATPLTSQTVNSLTASYKPAPPVTTSQLSASYRPAMPLSQPIASYSSTNAIQTTTANITNNYHSTVRPTTISQPQYQTSQNFPRTTLGTTPAQPSTNYSVSSHSTLIQPATTTTTFVTNDRAPAVQSNVASSLLRQTANFINNQTAPLYTNNTAIGTTFLPATPVHTSNQHRVINNNYQNDRAQYSGN
jgi:hypothetical protein